MEFALDEVTGKVFFNVDGNKEEVDFNEFMLGLYKQTNLAAEVNGTTVTNERGFIPTEVFLYEPFIGRMDAFILGFKTQKNRKNLIGPGGQLLVQVGCPETVIVAHIESMRMKSIFLGIVKEETHIEIQTPIFRFPFGNVYENFKLCLGQVPTKLESDTLSHVKESVTNAVYASGFNGDMAYNAENLMNSLVNKDFPDERLVAGESITLEELIKRAKQ